MGTKLTGRFLAMTASGAALGLLGGPLAVITVPVGMMVGAGMALALAAGSGGRTDQPRA